MTLELCPINWAAACKFIRLHHRHHLPPQGWKYGIGVVQMGELVGIVTVGRPVARHYDNGVTLEVTRCCTDGTKHAASMLYGAAWRAAKALGYKRLITYTLQSEPGTSLVAAGWKIVNESAGGGEWTRPGRERKAAQYPTEQKTLWDAQP